MKSPFALQALRSIAGFWAAAVLVVMGIYDPVNDDRLPVERVPLVWIWYGIQISACIVLMAWTTNRLAQVNRN